MLTLYLTPIFKARGVEKPYTFLVKAGFTPRTASKLVSNKALVLNLSHLEILCRVLFCEPNDLFLYTPKKKLPLVENHPLLKFGHQEAAKNFQEIISTMPFKQLKEMTKTIADKTDL